MNSLRPEDYCPECGCGYRKDDEHSDIRSGGWDGYCGHFDCGACSMLRAEKDRLTKNHKELKERYADR